MMHDITRLTLPFSDECPTKFYSCQFLKIISIRKWCVWHVKLFVEQLSEQIGNWMVKKEIGNQRLNCGMWLYPFCCEIWYTLNITRKQTLSLFLFRRGSSTSPKVCTLQSTWNSTILCTFNLIHPSTRFPEVSLDYTALSGAFTKGLLTDLCYILPISTRILEIIIIINISISIHLHFNRS